MNIQSRLSASAERIEEVAQTIGQPSLTRLCELFGGTRIYVPRNYSPKHPVAVAIGMKAAVMLAEHFYATTIDLPKAHARRHRVLELAKSGEMTIAEAALACDYTERRVYQLLAAEKTDDGQLDLFDKP